MSFGNMCYFKQLIFKLSYTLTKSVPSFCIYCHCVPLILVWGGLSHHLLSICFYRASTKSLRLISPSPALKVSSVSWIQCIVFGRLFYHFKFCCINDINNLWPNEYILGMETDTNVLSPVVPQSSVYTDYPIWALY